MDGFYYKGLGREEKAAYEQMKTGFEQLMPAVRVIRLERERLAEVYLRLKLDTPLLFYVTGELSQGRPDGSGGGAGTAVQQPHDGGPEAEAAEDLRRIRRGAGGILNRNTDGGDGGAVPAMAALRRHSVISGGA